MIGKEKEDVPKILHEENILGLFKISTFRCHLINSLYPLFGLTKQFRYYSGHAWYFTLKYRKKNLSDMNSNLIQWRMRLNRS